ncbi:MAG: hypothetical protein MJ052_04110, partial [Sphaerochaetaceae bacterium]|nr:hypothetical protein [Sphaerochaetaceae bacterium]
GFRFLWATVRVQFPPSANAEKQRLPLFFCVYTGFQTGNYQKSVLNRKGKFRIHEWNFAIGSKHLKIL